MLTFKNEKLHPSYRVFKKSCVVSKFTATIVSRTLISNCNPSPVSRRATPLDYYWLGIFCTTNSSPALARERLQNLENS